MAPPASRGLSIPGLPTHGNRVRAIAGEEKSPSHKKPITRVQSWPADADKPLATARGISCRIQLAEPHVYVYGLKPANRDIAAHQFPPAIIRGKLILKIDKATKLKARLEYQVLPFFNALLPNQDDGFGAQCSYALEDCGPTASSLKIDPALSEALSKVMDGSKKKPRPVLTAHEQKVLQRRLSCSMVRPSSFENEQSSGASARRMASTPQKGYKLFPPGVYEYSFEITLDHRLPETMNLPMGSVHWRLESRVERHGAFKTSLLGKQEVLVVRAPQVNAEDHLLEPISFTQSYEEVICHVLIQGSAFPIGGKMPVVFTFTPLEKVEVRAVWISILEETKYSCHNGLHSKDGTKREVKIFEKRAGKPVSEEYGGVDVRFSEGGELSPEQRVEARAQAESLRRQVSAATGVSAEPLPEAGDNLLGDLDLGLDHFIGQTVMEFYLRLAKLKPDKSGVPRKVEFTKGFAVNITLLSCLATLARTTLPIYCDNSNPGAPTQTAECGCPNATTINSSSLTTASRNDLLAGFSNIGGSDLPVPPVGPGDNSTPRIRPIQMLRYPSYAPPPFDADQPPPSVNSPPPNYDNVVGTPSHDGLADYFSRMANMYDGDQGEGENNDNDDELESESESGSESNIRRNISRSGRVYIMNPRSPGPGALSNSMEINRDFMFRRELVDTMQETQAGTGTTSQPGGTEPEDNIART
ncbi:hypothetical protein V498_06047 [Pseudogymnoascus sp. VKM F-4517 (FW-2822)]|nr:hypothetical protein V498_06047 [Pseudogymnoascus sp. VKM F-4517 (FW-2822)]